MAQQYILVVSSVAGDSLAVIPEASADWYLNEVVARLPELLPGRMYTLLCSDKPLAEEVTLQSWLGEGGNQRAITAVVGTAPNADEALNLALIKVAGENDLELVKKYMEGGASAKFVHNPEGTWGAKDKKSALHMAITARRRLDSEDDLAKNDRIISMLLDAKADVNAKRESSDWRGCGSSQTAFEMILPAAMQDPVLLRRFLDVGADPNTQSLRTVHSMRTDGYTKAPILVTAAGKGTEAVRVLLEARADANAVRKETYHNERGYNRNEVESSLHIASKSGDVALLALLMEHGANVHTTRKELVHEEVARSDPEGTDDPRDDNFESSVRCVPVEETALHLAIRHGHPTAVALLVCAGADTNLAYKYGEKRTTPQELCQTQSCVQQLQTALNVSWPSAEASAFFETSALPDLGTAIARGLEGKAPPPVPDRDTRFPHDDGDDDEFSEEE